MKHEDRQSETDSGVDTGIVRRKIPPDPAEAEYDFLEVDHVVERLFQRPPSSASQMEISFSYTGYRGTVDQLGDVELVEVKDTRSRSPCPSQRTYRRSASGASNSTRPSGSLSVVTASSNVAAGSGVS